MIYKNCLRCGRKLRSVESKEVGFGKICWEKYNSENNYKELFKMEENNVQTSSNASCDKLSNE